VTEALLCGHATLAGRDVTVHAVAPGPAATAQAVPLERLGIPDDIAPAVAFLASPGRALDHRPDNPG
jgi:NAD(P)-dependent dehydrogenase (short-subunit alcohol dehydrogenase family)